ncbi:MAG: hypothetical protein AMS17_03330 [Spirochaetes bacterium DG_61]|nr:MAG: hypothetical protein AMS17_03330 [Spirochaetes bacterium DG_61]
MKRFLPLYLSVCLTAVLLISGCAGGKAKRGALKTGLIQASSSKTPSWITDIPEEKSYYYFVGTSVDSESYDAGKKSALNDALSQVVGMIGLKVSSSSTIEERYFAEQYTTIISAELYSEGRAKLQDAEIREIYYEQHRRKDGSEFVRVWALLKYSKSEIKKEQERLKEILALKYGELTRLEEKASNALQKGMLFDAIVAHLNAASAALNIDDGEVLFDRNMNRAGEILARIRFKKFQEDQVGWVGRALEKPLQLQVYFLEGEQVIPVPDVPVRFSYRIPRKNRAGYKYQVVNATTDSRGFAAFSVDQVYEVSDHNRVDARMDLGPYIEQMRSVPDALIDRVKTIEDILATKRAVFTFRSDTFAREIRTAVYFMQLDQDGTLLPKPVTAPAVYEILYDKRFLIRVLDVSPGSFLNKPEDVILQKLLEGAGKGVQRILFGSVRILEYDMLSGFHTVRAEAKVTLYDRESGDVLRTWQITRSATGATKLLAGNNVLSEAGKSLGEMISNTMP